MSYCKATLFTDDRGCKGIMPVYKTKEAACADVALPYPVTIKPGEVVKVDLLVGFDIPNGKKIVMYPRSSLLMKYGLMSPTSIIDSDYRGQHIHWPVINLGGDPITLDTGTRVAQIELCSTEQVVDWDLERNERTGGFGSTGEGK
jgi:deoxyuridine 5'-triphosphate nucleotidohydrolase